MIPQKKHLIAHYKLNGAKDETGLVKDFSGNNNGGTIVGTEAYSDNQFGKKCQVFNGSTSITHDSIATDTIAFILNNIIYIKSGSNYYTNGILSEGFTVYSTNTSIGSGLSGNLNNVMHFNVELSPTEVKQLVDELNSPPEFSPKMTPSLTSDGIDDYIDTGLVNGNMSKIELYYIPVATGTNQILVGGIGAATSLFTQIGGTINTLFRVSGDRRTPRGSLTFGVATKIVADYNAEKIYINDIEQSLIAGSGILGSSGNMLLMKRATGDNTNATWFYIKLWDKLGVLVRHFIPQSDGTMLDIVNNVVYSNSGTGTLIYKQEPLVIEDGLVFYTRDGVKDLSGKNSISTTNAIIGKGIILNSGTVNWQNLTPTSYIYVWEDSSGNIKHYGYNGTLYINSIAGGSQPIIIGSTGISSVTGKLHSIKIYNEVKSADEIRQDYEKESRFW